MTLKGLLHAFHCARNDTVGIAVCALHHALPRLVHACKLLGLLGQLSLDVVRSKNCLGKNKEECMSTTPDTALTATVGLLLVGIATIHTSRYIHCFWHVSHSSRVSDNRIRRRCQVSTSSRIGAQKREPRIVFRVTRESSRPTWSRSHRQQHKERRQQETRPEPFGCLYKQTAPLSCAAGAGGSTSHSRAVANTKFTPLQETHRDFLYRAKHKYILRLLVRVQRELEMRPNRLNLLREQLL